MDAETRAAHTAHARHVATGEEPIQADKEEAGPVLIRSYHPDDIPEGLAARWVKDSDEEAGGFWAYPASPAPTVDAGPVENASEQAHRCYHQWTRSGHRTAPAPPAAAPDPRDALLNSVRVDLGTILANTLNPAHTMTGRGLEEVVDACHEIAGRALAKLEPNP